MHFDLDTRRARLGVGELAGFAVGPREPGDGGAGLWRARLGTEWHRQLRAAAAVETGAEFEVPVEGVVVRGGWALTLNGRIDQVLSPGGKPALREIKTVARALPEAEGILRSDYPAYFVQLAAYAALWRRGGEAGRPRAELVFVEGDNGLVQTVELAPADEAALDSQLARVAEFLDLRLRARNRRRSLRFRAAFPSLRPGQETARAELESALAEQPSALLLEAPTGFGKTGVLLEAALDQLRMGRFDRVLYLTGKSTGQLQVVRTLTAMTAPGAGEAEPGAAPVAVWHVRNKAEHCVNPVFHCVRGTCGLIEGVAGRWPQSGLARFYLFDDEPRDLESLREGGRRAGICPYEITRAALAYQDIWIGDYNYVFAPSSRGVFYEQPGFQPERTLLIIDEAHNLPGRVAGAYSHALASADAVAAAEALHQAEAPVTLRSAWEEWARFLGGLTPAAVLPPEEEQESRRHLADLADLVAASPVDYAALGPWAAARLWQIPAIAQQLADRELSLLWWCPTPGELSITCLDAAPAIGDTLRDFGAVVLASATPGPAEIFSAACAIPIHPIRAATPWRDGAYDVACDLRVDTTFHHRAQHYDTTAATVAALWESGGRNRADDDPAARAVAVFFPSYAYAEAIAARIAAGETCLRVALQPRLSDLSAQAAWVEEALASAGALFLILGSSFAESIDLLGGRVSRAMVVGPSLPEVNAVQKARMTALSGLGRAEAFRRTYQIPGMQKVNQALGRLVRAPGQRARVLLHCRRFAEPSYAELLDPDYRAANRVRSDGELDDWLASA